MLCKDRNGQFINRREIQHRVLRRLYGSRKGRRLLKVLVRPFVSKMGGWVLNRKISCIAIKPFIKKAGICMAEYEERKFRSYNDFFTRKIKPEMRVVDADPSHLVSPCDGRLTVHTVTEGAEFLIKNTKYTMESLTRDKGLAERYRGGQLLMFRLTVDDYHRYCYADSGFIGKNSKIPGVFHTVDPSTNNSYPLYKENERSLSILESDNFGALLIIEVGALMVGKIINYDENKKVSRGDEKGRFEFGGSTIIICAEKGKVKIDEDIWQNSKNNIETKVRYGMNIGSNDGGVAFS